MDVRTKRIDRQEPPHAAVPQILDALLYPKGAMDLLIITWSVYQSKDQA